MKRVITIAAILLGVAACGQNRTNYQEFEGAYYGGGAKGDSRGSAAFTATVRGVSQGLEGARQAALYEGVQYCIRFYGTSDILWEHAPDAPQEALLIDRDSLTVRGACVDPAA